MFYRILAIGLGLLATALFILAVATFYGYVPASIVGNLTAGELGTFGFVAGAGAVGAEVMDRHHYR